MNQAIERAENQTYETLRQTATATEHHLATCLALLELDTIYYGPADIAVIQRELCLSADFEDLIHEKKTGLRQLCNNHYVNCLREEVINIFKISAKGQGIINIEELRPINIKRANTPIERLRAYLSYFMDNRKASFYPDQNLATTPQLKHYIDQLIELLKNWKNYEQASLEEANVIGEPESREILERLSATKKRVHAILSRYYLR